MQRDLRVYLADVQQAIAHIQDFTLGMTHESYQSDLRTRRAVEREFTIIAEALSRIAHISPELRQRVDSVRQIANFRNIIIHEYDVLDDDYVWKTVQDFIPILALQIDAWAAELDAIKP
jgi:uncharacterized protein with HEPN domain